MALDYNNFKEKMVYTFIKFSLAKKKNSLKLKNKDLKKIWKIITHKDNED